MYIHCTKATFDPSTVSGDRTVAAHAKGGIIPSGAFILGGFLETVTIVDSADHSGTLAVSIESANDIQTAANISGAPWSTTGQKAITPKFNTPESTAIKLTANRQITFTVATTALTAGKVIARIFWVQ